MKLKSQEKLDDVQLRIKLNEKHAEMLKQYVVYANTQLGHHFDDVKELAVEVFRAFLEGDRGFKQWMAKQSQEGQAKVTVQKQTKKVEIAFENGLGAK